MGLDFTALVHYAGPSGDVLQSIARLEAGEEDTVLAEVVACGQRNDFAFAMGPAPCPFWRSLNDYEHRLPHRPSLPSLEACLELPSGFSLTFGRDTVWIYHMLRWIFFVTEAEWQEAMVAAVKQFCELFRANDCIITNDCQPAVSEFRRGASFAESLMATSGHVEGQVASLGELYQEVDANTDIALKPVQGCAAESLEAQLFLWPQGKPLPKGWSRPKAWDSKGFRRYQWQGK
jgi:hypothetical protein